MRLKQTNKQTLTTLIKAAAFVGIAAQAKAAEILLQQGNKKLSAIAVIVAINAAVQTYSKFLK